MLPCPQAERTRGKEFADKLAMPVLARAWQMLLKGMEEVSRANNALMAAEMLLIRMAHICRHANTGSAGAPCKGDRCRAMVRRLCKIQRLLPAQIMPQGNLLPHRVRRHPRQVPACRP